MVKTHAFYHYRSVMVDEIFKFPSRIANLNVWLIVCEDLVSCFNFKDEIWFVQDSKDGNLVEDKDTQTDKCSQSTNMHHPCCAGNGTCSSQNSTCNSTCTVHESTCVMHNNVKCLSPEPSTSKEGDMMETDSVQNDPEEENPLLVSQHNPLLSNSSSLVDDLNSFLDPIIPPLSNVRYSDIPT